MRCMCFCMCSIITAAAHKRTDVNLFSDMTTKHSVQIPSDQNYSCESGGIIPNGLLSKSNQLMKSSMLDE